MFSNKELRTRAFIAIPPRGKTVRSALLLRSSSSHAACRGHFNPAIKKIRRRARILPRAKTRDLRKASLQFTGRDKNMQLPGTHGCKKKPPDFSRKLAFFLIF